jgi:hypothetical protein
MTVIVLRKVNIIVSVRPSAWNNSAPAGRILMKLEFYAFFFRNSVEKTQV